MKQIVKYLAYSSVWISLCAYALTCATYTHEPHVTAYFHPIVLLITGATLFAYNGHNIIKLFGKSQSERNIWNRKNKWILYLGICLGLAMMAICLPEIPIAQVLLFAAFFGATAIYSVPLLIPKTRLINSDSFAIIKPFYLASIWWLITFGVPFYIDDIAWHTTAIIDGVYRFLLLLITCIVFDIKDMHTDKAAGLVTLPQKIGKERLLKVLLACTFFIIISLIVIYLFTHQEIYAILVFIFGLTFFILKRANKKGTELFYVFEVDSLLFLYALSILFFNQIN